MTTADLETYHRERAARAQDVFVYDGIEVFLAEAPFGLGVFTGASALAASILLRSAGLVEHFDVIVGGDEIARPKPDPMGLELACSRLGVAPIDSAYVGDSPLDLGAAKAAGCLSVAAAWGHLHDPDEPADLVAHHSGELLALIAGVGRA